MIEMSTIGSAISSLNLASGIAKGLIGLRDMAMIQGKVIELQSAILAAQSSALTAQSDQLSLIMKIQDLEKQIADLEAWNAEKERYALTEISPGALAYVVTATAKGSAPVHAICANCYEHGRKSILQWGEDSWGTLTFKCSKCGAGFYAQNPGPAGSFRLAATSS